MDKDLAEQVADIAHRVVGAYTAVESEEFIQESIPT